MATYSEIFSLRNESDLRNRVTVAVVVAANNILDLPTPTAPQKSWAAGVLQNPDQAAGQAYFALLAANRSATISQIVGASDAAIQSRVDAIVSLLVDAQAGV